MNTALKFAFPALLVGGFLATLPAAQAQTPSTDFTPTPSSRPHLGSLTGDPSTDLFIGVAGTALLLDWATSGGHHGSSDFSAADVKTPSIPTIPGGGGLNPAPVPEAGTNVSLGLMLLLGTGGMALAARRQKKA